MSRRYTQKQIDNDTAEVFLDIWGTGTHPQRWKGFKYAVPGYVPEWLHSDIPPSHKVDDSEHDLNEDLCVSVIAPSGAFGVKPPKGYRIAHMSGCSERECPECEAKGTVEYDEGKPKKCKMCGGDCYLWWGDECQLVVFCKNVKPKPFKGPKLTELASDLWAVVKDSRSYKPEDIADEEGNPSIDVRLQVYADGRWALRTGDSSYDQDHRGYWGAGSVSPDMKKSDVRSLAKELIEEAADQYASDHPSMR